jgi:hypothetical protein
VIALKAAFDQSIIMQELRETVLRYERLTRFPPRPRDG